MGALRQSMAALGARTIADMHDVEIVYAPSVVTEGKSWQQRGQLGARAIPAALRRPFASGAPDSSPRGAVVGARRAPERAGAPGRSRDRDEARHAQRHEVDARTFPRPTTVARRRLTAADRHAGDRVR